MSKLNIFEEYADLFEAEDIDPKEYDYEGEMAKDQLVTMADAASELHDMLDDTENLPEWCQNKISKSTRLSLKRTILNKERKTQVQKIYFSLK